MALSGAIEDENLGMLKVGRATVVIWMWFLKTFWLPGLALKQSAGRTCFRETWKECHQSIGKYPPCGFRVWCSNCMIAEDSESELAGVRLPINAIHIIRWWEGNFKSFQFNFLHLEYSHLISHDRQGAVWDSAENNGGTKGNKKIWDWW